MPYHIRQQQFQDTLDAIGTDSPSFCPDTRNNALEDTSQKIKQALEDGNYALAIFYLTMHKDLSLGMHAHFNEEKQIYVRDARHYVPPVGSHYQNWAQMGLSYAASVHVFLENHCQDEHKKNNLQNTLKAYAKAYLTQIRKCENELEAEQYSAHFVHQYLIPLMQRTHVNHKDAHGDDVCKPLPKNGCVHYLSIAKDFSYLNLAPYATATVTRHVKDSEPHDFAHIDVPIYQLTDSQQEEMQAIAVNNKKLPQWFTNHAMQIQRLIQHYANDILQGRVLPTQLRKTIPGLRNAAEERVYALNDNKPLALIYQGYHSGNLGHQTQNSTSRERTRQTTLALAQLSNELNASEIYVQSLTTPANYRLAEKNLETQIHAACNTFKTTKCYHSNVPLNDFRRVKPIQESGVHTLLSHVCYLLANYEGGLLVNQNPKKTVFQLLAQLMDAYPEGLPLENAKTYLKNNKQSDMAAKILQLAVEVHRVRLGSEMADNNNLNALLVTKESQLVFQLNAFYEADPAAKAEALLVNILKLDGSNTHLGKKRALQKWLTSHLENSQQVNQESDIFEKITAYINGATFIPSFKTLFILSKAEEHVKEKYRNLVKILLCYKASNTDDEKNKYREEIKTLLKDDAFKQTVIAKVRFCQSGIDREGIARLLTVIDSINHHLTHLSRHYIKPFYQHASFYLKLIILTGIPAAIKHALRNNKAMKKQRAEVIISASPVVKAAHVQAYPSGPGGTPGAFGIKVDSEGALSYHLKPYKNSIVYRTASFNKKPPKEFKANDKAVITKVVLGVLLLFLGIIPGVWLLYLAYQQHQHQLKQYHALKNAKDALQELNTIDIRTNTSAQNLAALGKPEGSSSSPNSSNRPAHYKPVLSGPAASTTKADDAVHQQLKTAAALHTG